MSSVSPKDIKKLRDTTGAGFMDCKNALINTKSDINLAIDWLRKNGVATAEKKGARTATDGLIAIDSNDTEGSIIEINSETDFVARNKEFQDFVSEISKISFNLKGNIDKINAATYKPASDTVSNYLINLISKIGEKISIRRAKYIKSDNGFIGTYIHNVEKDNMGKIGVILSVSTNIPKNKIDNFLKTISMHIAATSPISLNINNLDKKLVQKEREIVLEQLKSSSGKSKDQSILEKIIDGKMKKFYNEVVLLEQNFIIDDKIKVGEYIKSHSKELGGDLSINEFIRFKVGEGLE
tara:strand:- start:1093 stop:1980 length:888 start_codon:yes stop_codon:yes gene_type:complete